MPPRTRKRGAAEGSEEATARKKTTTTKAVVQETNGKRGEEGERAAGEATSKAAKKSDTPTASEGESLSAPPPGGSKMDTLAPAEMAKNTTIDDPLVLDNIPKPEGTTRITSWNILSLKSSMGKGFLRYMEAEQADVAILTETKCNDVPMVPTLNSMYPHQTWGIGKTKGYAGIALLSKPKPIKVTVGIPDWDTDTKGRIITAEYDRFILIGTYVVNAGEGLKSLAQKEEWNEHFSKHLAACDARKPTIWTGDLNVVVDARDLSNASKKWNKSPGYTRVECEHHRRILAGTAQPGAQRYVDVWRERHGDAVGHYTYYGFRGMCRSKGIGWRLDSFIVPERIASQVRSCEVRQTVYGASDHVPIYMDIEGTL